VPEAKRGREGVDEGLGRNVSLIVNRNAGALNGKKGDFFKHRVVIKSVPMVRATNVSAFGLVSIGVSRDSTENVD